MMNWPVVLGSGEITCFTRPEMKVERVSHDVMTPRRASYIRSYSLEACYPLECYQNRGA